ncbi:MAG: ABC transporter permease subunit [bacterium]|nr:ABC transporter permease subunit [bacterium]
MVSRALAAKEWRETRWKHLVGLLVLSGLGVVIVATFEWVRGMGDMLKAIPLPPEAAGMLAAQLSNHYVYLWTNWYSKNLYQIATILALVVGMSVVAAETGRGTLGFLFTRPLSRTAIFTTKYLVGAAGLAAAITGSTLVTWAAAIAWGYPVALARFAPGLAPALAGTLVVYGLAVVCSALSRDQVRAGVAAALAALVLSVPGYFPRTAAFSVFRQMQAVYYLSTGSLRWDALAGVLAVALILALAAGYLFVRKEA